MRSSFAGQRVQRFWRFDDEEEQLDAYGFFVAPRLDEPHARASGTRPFSSSPLCARCNAVMSKLLQARSVSNRRRFSMKLSVTQRRRWLRGPSRWSFCSTHSKVEAWRPRATSCSGRAVSIFAPKSTNTAVKRVRERGRPLAGRTVEKSFRLTVRFLNFVRNDTFSRLSIHPLSCGGGVASA